MKNCLSKLTMKTQSYFVFLGRKATNGTTEKRKHQSLPDGSRLVNIK